MNVTGEGKGGWVQAKQRERERGEGGGEKMGEQKESGEKGTVASKGKDTTPRTETRRALTFCVDDAFNRFNVFCTWCLLSVFFFV